MKAPAEKSSDTQRQAAAHAATQQQASAEAEYAFVDNREETADLRQLQETADNSPQAQGLTQLSAMMNNGHRSAAMQNLQAMVDNSPRQFAQRQLHSRIQSTTMGLMAESGNEMTVQRAEDDELLQGKFTAESPVQLAQPPDDKPNNTGLPDNLKSGIESLSGMSMDNVKVHYNSSEPAKLNAHAYAQGTDIHLGPGQKQHLPHEAWHVVQQTQGRVKPTVQMKDGVGVNDDQGLETEADLMGERALQGKWGGADSPTLSVCKKNKAIQRRKVGKFGVEAEVGDGSFLISAPKDTKGGSLIQDEDVSFEERKLADIDGHVSVTLDGEVSSQTESRYKRMYTIEYIQRPVDVELESGAELDAVATAWGHALAFWQAHIGDNQALKTELGDWYNLQQTWHGEHFKDKEDVPGVTDEGEAQFDWTNEAYLTAIVAKEKDPAVSMQMTAGSTLLGLLEVYLETVSILSGGAIADGQHRESIDSQRRISEEKPEATELNSFIYLISKYIEGNGNTKGDRQRSYAKEYVTLMSRTSLDLVYQQLSVRAKGVFDTRVAAYLFNKDPNPLIKAFNRPANERVFVKDAKKEDVSEITIEQLLLSIIKKKRAEVDGALVVDDAAEKGDVLVQNNLVGLGEINQGAPDMVAKFGLNNPGEMMQGIPGMIFENRAAMPHKLSAMPELFLMLADSLHQVNVAHEQALARAQQPAQAAASGSNCYLTTACVTLRGLPDDCEELQVLRAFRDEVIARLPVGPDLIKCYYSQAPGIVEAIDAHTERRAIYDQIYEIIGFCVGAIKGGHEAVALAAYCEMVIGLERAFGSGEHCS